MNREGKDVKQKKEEKIFPVVSSQAFRAALEDAETSYFIKTNFSSPEQGFQIISRKKLSRQKNGYRWIVEFIEKSPVSLNGKNEMMNIARIEVDPFNGKVMDRQFFTNVFYEEYEKAV
jgi:hypothetical protein